jgi:spore coat protein U-like protein
MKFSKMGRLLGVAVCAGLVAVLVPNVASAGGATGSSPGTLTVNATVADNCTIGNSTLSFGAYDPLVTNASTDLSANTTISYACVKDPSDIIWIDLGAGGHNGAGPIAGDNAMEETSNGTDHLSYQLYQNAGLTLKWGTGDPGATPASGKGVRVTSPGLGGTTITVYGVIPAGQNVTASATYSDSVTETINF